MWNRATQAKEISMSTETQTPPSPSLSQLAHLRAELSVQIHLAKIEARAEWEKLEQLWVDLEKKAEDLEKASAIKAQALEKASAESARDLKAAAELLIGEIGLGYERIRKIFF
jgi:hypothetical protein